MVYTASKHLFLFIMNTISKLLFGRWLYIWRVRYPDGKLSMYMSKEKARGYARMFGGKVETASPSQEVIED